MRKAGKNEEERHLRKHPSLLCTQALSNYKSFPKK